MQARSCDNLPDYLTLVGSSNWYTFGMEETIKKIVNQEFNVEVISIREIIGRGLNNLVFYIATEKDPLILRMKKSLPELETYRKEKLSLIHI